MPEVLTPPVEAATLDAHEALDEVAHATIANTEDEDYKWLTDRLDALQLEVNQLRSQQSSSQETILTAFRESQSNSQRLMETQAKMIETLTASLAQVNASVLSMLTPPNSESLSRTESESEPITETVVNVVPEVTAEPVASTVREKKRLRM